MPVSEGGLGQYFEPEKLDPKNINIKKGDKFESSYYDAVYTVTDIYGNKNGEVTVEWDCVGRKYWYKRVNLKSIIEWIEDGRLKPLPNQSVQ